MNPMGLEIKQTIF